MRNLTLLATVLLVTSLISFLSFAQEMNPLLSEEEVNIRNIAKKKLYLGGKDEEPIKVQAQLPLIIRRQGPTQEIEVPEEPTSHDAD